MFEKDKLNILSMLDAADKIFEYTKGYSTADEFYNSQRDFDAAMMNFIVLGEMVTRLLKYSRKNSTALIGIKSVASETSLRITISVLMRKRFGRLFGSICQS